MGWVILGLIILSSMLAILAYSQYVIRRNLLTITKRLDTSRAKRMRDELRIEKEVRERITKEHLKLRKENQKLKDWYDIEKRRLSKGGKNEYQKLEIDRSYLTAKLDKLLGLKSSKSANKK